MTTLDAQEVLRTSNLRALTRNELSDVLNGLVKDLLGADTTGTHRLQRIGAIEGIRNLMPNDFQDMFVYSVSAGTASNTLACWNILTAMMRTKPWLLFFVGGLEKGRINQTLKAADISDSNLQTLVINCLFIDSFQPVAIQRLTSFPLDALTRNRANIPTKILLQEAVRRLLDSSGVDATYPIMTQLIEPNVFHLKLPLVKNILNAYKSNRHVRESYAAIPLLEKILTSSRSQELGSRYLWLSLLESITNWNDQAKESLRAYIEMIIPEEDLNEVPF